MGNICVCVNYNYIKISYYYQILFCNFPLSIHNVFSFLISSVLENFSRLFGVLDWKEATQTSHVTL